MSQNHNFGQLKRFLASKIVGQTKLIDRILIALLADGHLLVEGAPGLAKTRAIQMLGKAIEGECHRVQFTPDLLPADLTGTDIFNPKDGQFQFQKGPLFHNIVLADEINRAPAKVQSALLEAMAERQITVGQTTWPLPDPFMVMATQNPLEQEGTYQLPEAQMDRFLMHVLVDYPNADEERLILLLGRQEARNDVTQKTDETSAIVTPENIRAARMEVLDIFMAEAVEQYLLEIVMATRSPERYGNTLTGRIAYGASPRATLALDRCARAHAWLHDRNFVTPEDVQAVAHDVLRHRVLMSFEAEAEGMTSKQLIDQLLSVVAVP